MTVRTSRNRVWIREWETFQLVDLGDNKVALLAANEKYVSLKETVEPEVEAPKLVAFTNHISDNEKFELVEVRSGRWRYNNLTAATGAPPGADTPTGYTWDIDNTQHVVYRGEDKHIHELWFHQDSGWHHHDLTATIIGIPLSIGNIVGYTWSVDNTQHIVYVSTNYTVRELWFHQDSGWHHNNLTAVTGAPPVASDPSGYTWDADETQHVVYRGQDGHIHELWFHQDSGWHHHDLTEATGAPSARSAPVGYTWDVDGTQHVVYLGEDGNIHELWFVRWEAV